MNQDIDIQDVESTFIHMKPKTHRTSSNLILPLILKQGFFYESAPGQDILKGPLEIAPTYMSVYKVNRNQLFIFVTRRRLSVT